MAAVAYGRPRPASLLCASAVAAGTVLLALRPEVARAVGWSAPAVALLFAAVLGLGLAAPAAGSPRELLALHTVRVAPAGPVAATAAQSPGGSRTGWLLSAGGRRWVPALLAGAAVFCAGRLMSPGAGAEALRGLALPLTVLASVAEEALYRRAAFAALAPYGPVAAVGVPALLFALGHVTVYGWWAFPLDAAAGLVLGWQRWVSGSWAVPAVTHVVADVLASL